MTILCWVPASGCCDLRVGLRQCGLGDGCCPTRFGDRRRLRTSRDARHNGARDGDASSRRDSSGLPDPTRVWERDAWARGVRSSSHSHSQCKGSETGGAYGPQETPDTTALRNGDASSRRDRVPGRLTQRAYGSVAHAGASEAARIRTRSAKVRRPAAPTDPRRRAAPQCSQWRCL